MAKLKRMYEVRKLEGKPKKVSIDDPSVKFYKAEPIIIKTPDGKDVQAHDKDGNPKTKLTQVVGEIAQGYLVSFPRAHQIHVETKEQLARMHLDGESGIVDMDTGIPIEKSKPMSLEELVKRNTREPPISTDVA